MASERAVYMGPRLRRLRRDLGLTQSDMAGDLEISPSYIALLERNQRPLTADMLLRIARTYKLDMADFAGDGGADYVKRLQAILKDPMFADIDLPQLQTADVATNYPGITEAFVRVYTAFKEEQLALADRGAEGGQGGGIALDPVGEVRRFLTARRNSFPAIDDAAERLAADIADAGGALAFLERRHGLKVQRVPSEFLAGTIRRFDFHRRRVLIDEGLTAESRGFQLAVQLAHLELNAQVQSILGETRFETVNAGQLARGSLYNYAAAALLMPYGDFARAVEAKHYDVEALARQFGTSFEQTAHRLTTLQKPGQERIPFFFIRLDRAGNVSKRLDGAGFPFARHGGGCPLWSVHDVFQTPGKVVTQWLDLPDGQRFFSIARTVTSGGGAYGAMQVQRAIALGCAAQDAARLIYTRNLPTQQNAVGTPIGVTCALCQRSECRARSAPPIGREVLATDHYTAGVPFAFAAG